MTSLGSTTWRMSTGRCGNGSAWSSSRRTPLSMTPVTVEVFRGELGEDGIAERVAALTGN